MTAEGGLRGARAPSPLRGCRATKACPGDKPARHGYGALATKEPRRSWVRVTASENSLHPCHPHQLRLSGRAAKPPYPLPSKGEGRKGRLFRPRPKLLPSARQRGG